MGKSKQGTTFSRRDFLKLCSQCGVALAASGLVPRGLAAVDRVDNPLAAYPARDWEKVYRNLFAADESFTFLCAPNDTHNCLLRAQVKNGVVTRIGPTYGYGKATDVYGNQASCRWDPRVCQKGLALVRRFYGDRRCKQPMVREGFKRWVDAGFPRDNAGRPPADMFQRGSDRWLAATWDEAFELAAKAYVNIAETYTGPAGAERLKAQGYDESMIADLGGAGTKTLKFRGGMPFLGTTRLMGLYRFANSMALVDAKLRGVGPDKAVGGRGWDNYSWHTDLPPGHPMVTGQQTIDFDLALADHAKLILPWGMNWLTTKMPDSHWLTEARAKGAKVVCITVEYSATSKASDETIVIRPATDPAFALGLAQVIIKERLYDDEYVKTSTDLPLLVRLDTLTLLRANEVFPGHQSALPEKYAKIVKTGETPPPPGAQPVAHIPEALAAQLHDWVVWNSAANAPAALSRNDAAALPANVTPALEGTFTVALADGKSVQARPVFDLIREYLDANFTPEATAAITWAPAEAIVSLAHDIANAREGTLFAVGMGPNQFFNADLKDRTIFLVAALTKNIGGFGGNVGSYAGNYRVALFNGSPQYINEDPFNIELDPDKPAKVKAYWKPESAHYFNYGDRPLRLGNKLFTGKTHTPSPTKAVWVANSNSLLGNAKWHFDLMFNTLPKVDMVLVSDWWWTASCEYADVVFAVDAWSEFKLPDMAGSVTNPFVTVFPRTPLARTFNTRGDIEVLAGIGEKLAAVTGETKFRDYWKFAGDKPEVYLQRVCNASTGLKGYKFTELEAKAKDGVPALLMTRTYPKAVGWEQTQEKKPWYTKTGRLEFYRDEPEFREHGENLPVYREPVDSTFYEPNVIVGAPHVAIKPIGPAEWGLDPKDQSVEVRQVRNIVKPWSALSQTAHPLKAIGYDFIFHTPKYRHGAHTTPVDTDIVAVLFGPFGDIYRHDKRKPFVSEGYVDIHPQDAKARGIEDGDYVWVDADPSDRPFRNAKKGTKAQQQTARLLCRARYYNGTPRGVTRMWFNMYGATLGSVRGHHERPDGLAKNPATNYQAMFRYGSHQSATRAWLRPTLMTDTLVRKDVYGQTIGIGYAPDIHSVVGAPREAFVKITKAEPGGESGKGLWRPAALGLRPTYESAAMKTYLKGGFVNG
ncbi:MAG: molybdopterin-dependent oxidoreductase [Deltaproteobacteria bacterium]|nr:molybdopterin-dependent oxidoreductase [Deltaproteobacteria bacterium]